MKGRYAARSGAGRCARTSGRIALVASGLLLGVLLAGCDDATQAPPATTNAAGASRTEAPGASQTQAAPRFASSQPADPGDAAGSSSAILQNDPSAPANTPLCGFAAQENNMLSRQLLSRQYAEAGQCGSYACYDAATATYIGADGYRHVCR